MTYKAPYYTNVGQSNTRILITHVGVDSGVTGRVHILLMDNICQQLDYFVCVTPNGTLTDTASSFDPLGSGYIIVLVVGTPGNFVPTRNWIIGNAFDNNGDFVGNYGAEAFWGTSEFLGVVPNDLKQDTATLSLKVPCEFAVEIQRPLDALQRIITVGLIGDVNTMNVSGAGQVGTGFGYNASERGGSYQKFINGGCYAEGNVTATNPRVPTTLAGVIPATTSSHLRFNVGAAVGLILTGKSSTSGWSGIRTLHKTKTTTATLTVPVFMPTC